MGSDVYMYRVGMGPSIKVDSFFFYIRQGIISTSLRTESQEAMVLFGFSVFRMYFVSLTLDTEVVFFYNPFYISKKK